MAESWSCPHPALLLPIPEPPCHGSPLAPPALADAREALRWHNGTGAACRAGPVALALMRRCQLVLSAQFIGLRYESIKAGEHRKLP